MEDNNSKEINLLQLISLFFDWLIKIGKNILKAVSYILRLTFRRKITFIIVILVAIAVGQYMSRKSARIYKAGATAMIYGGDAQTVRAICKQLENSTPANKLISLSTKLSLPDSVAKNIVAIGSYYWIDFMRDSVADVVDFKDKHSLSDTMNVRMRDRVYIQLMTKSISQVPVVQQAILNYLNNNSDLKTQFETKRNDLLQQIKICNTESARIDSLAKEFYFKSPESQLQVTNNSVLLGEQRKQLFYGELLRLQELRGAAQIKLADFKQPVDMPSGLVVDPFPINGRVKYGILSILIGYALAFVLAVLLENFKGIMSFLKKK